MSVNYRWRADGGHIDATGQQATFESDGLDEGFYRVSCLIYDAYGHSAECSTVVHVLADPHRCPTLTLASDKESAAAGELVTFAAALIGQGGGPSSRHIVWSASSGALTPSGSTAALDTTGLSDGVKVIVRVAAEDEPSCSALVTVRISTPRTHCGTLLGEARFEKNSADVTERVLAGLHEMVEAMDQFHIGRELSGGKLLVFGLTEPDEPVGLGIERARAVREYLVRYIGIDATRIVACSWVGTCHRAVPTGDRRVIGLVVGDDTPTEYVERSFGCPDSARLFVEDAQ